MVTEVPFLLLFYFFFIPVGHFPYRKKNLYSPPTHTKNLKAHLFPERSSSNASLIFSKGKTWVINGSNGNFLAMKSATSLGTESLLLKPERREQQREMQPGGMQEN